MSITGDGSAHLGRICRGYGYRLVNALGAPARRRTATLLIYAQSGGYGR
jgi:hypothetical protein